MNEVLLNFNEEKQEFNINKSMYENLDFREMALERLFNKDQSHLIIKNFIEEDVAKKIRDYYAKTKNSISFVQPSKGSNHRIFYYQNSPYEYPKFINSLINHCMVLKNRIYEYHDFYQIYCMIKDVNPKNYNEVARLQNLHSWSCIYWYKDGNSHFRHIDNFGELACFVIFTKKGLDYQNNGGGLQVEIGSKNVSMDDNYDYGDLVFLDQSQVFHEVLPVKTLGNQVGRIQLYVPTIPPNYMKKALIYEGYEDEVFFSDENITFEKKNNISNKVIKQDIHYSRKFFKHYVNKIGV